MLPKYVCVPVVITTAVAAPLSTDVPKKQMFPHSSGDWRPGGTGASDFSTGIDSPVRLDWMRNRSLAAISRTSAGIMSPAESLTKSPGTTSRKGTSWGWPLRIAVAVTRIIALSLAAASSARDSWTNRRPTPRTTIETITQPARASALRKETSDRTPSRITSGLRRARSSRHCQPCCFS